MNNTLHNTTTVLKIFFARLRFVAIFIIAALVVGYWDNLKNHVDKWTRPSIAPDTLAHAAASNIEYYCPMHPQVVRSEAGKCPICSMELVKRDKTKSQQLPVDVLARVQLSPRRIALANVQTTPVEYRQLLRDIRAVGVLDYNETKLAHISSRVAGRADELFIKYTGQQIKAGDPVYSLYSPEVYTAQREYLLARQRANELAKGGTADSRADAAAVYNASMQKLVLWGISQEQLEKLDQEFDRTGKIPSHFIVTSPIGGIIIEKDIHQGHYVQVGEDPYTVADLTTLWFKAKLFEQDIPLVKIGDTAELSVAAFPGRTFNGTVTFLAFQLDPETRTLDARVEVENADLQLRPGMFADVLIRVPLADHPVTATAPATQASSAPSIPATEPAHPAIETARIFADGLKPYLQGQKLLADDKLNGVSPLLHDTLSALRPLAEQTDFAADYAHLTAVVHKTMGQDLATLRETFKDVSATLIKIGKLTGIPDTSSAIDIIRCPMTDKPNWLQESGITANPYYGSVMLTCGGPIGTLPKISAQELPTTRRARPAGKVLAVPRSAVIDTGAKRIVYVESSPGIYDMRAVTLGPRAEDFYPVYSGLDESDKVVTVGGFLLDAENRLNPTVHAGETPSPAPQHQH